MSTPLNVTSVGLRSPLPAVQATETQGLSGIPAAQAQIAGILNGNGAAPAQFNAVNLSTPPSAATPKGLAQSMVGLAPDAIDPKGVAPLPPDQGMSSLVSRTLGQEPTISVASDLSILDSFSREETGRKIFIILKEGEVTLCDDPAVANELQAEGGELAVLMGDKKLMAANEKAYVAIMSAISNQQVLVSDSASEELKAKVKEGFEISEVIIFDSKELAEACFSKITEESREAPIRETPLQARFASERPPTAATGPEEEVTTVTTAAEELDVPSEYSLREHYDVSRAAPTRTSVKAQEAYQQKIILVQLQTMMLIAYNQLLERKIEAREREKFIEGLQRSFEDMTQDMKLEDIKRYAEFMQIWSKTRMFNGREIRVLGELFKDIFKESIPRAA